MLDHTPSVEEMTNYIMEDLLSNYSFKAKEISPYRALLRFDIIGINRCKREIRIVETKSGRADFTSDHKWQQYLPYCTHFAFAAPRGAIKPEELPKEIGLIEFWNEEGSTYGGETYWHLCHKYTRGCKKLRDRPDDEYYIDLLEGITMRLLSQVEEFRRYRHMFEAMDNISKEMVNIGDRLFDIEERLGVRK